MVTSLGRSPWSSSPWRSPVKISIIAVSGTATPFYFFQWGTRLTPWFWMSFDFSSSFLFPNATRKATWAPRSPVWYLTILHFSCNNSLYGVEQPGDMMDCTPNIIKDLNCSYNSIIASQNPLIFNTESFMIQTRLLPNQFLHISRMGQNCNFILYFRRVERRPNVIHLKFY